MSEEEKKAKLKSLIEEYEICYKESKYEGNVEEYKSLKETHKLLKDILNLLDKKDKVINKAFRYVRKKQSQQYKFALSRIECDELVKILKQEVENE